MPLRRFLVALVVTLVFLPQIAPAQKTDPKMVATLLKGWDENKDGVLEPDEVPDVARTQFARMAKRRGLDPRKALKVEILLATPDAKLKKSKVKKTPSEEGDALAEKKEKQQSKKSEVVQQTAKNGQAFGSGRAPTKAKGFRQLPTNDGQNLPTEENLSAADKKKAAALKRLQPLVKSMMSQYDKNKNGRLEKSEWSRIRGNPGASDQDNDGILSMDELTLHLAGYGQREVKVRSNTKSKSKQSRTKSSKRKTYRFLTAHERLPEGLPTWFTENDADEDGQLTLREYASSLSVAKLEKFQAFDLNGDGFIVADEYLNVTDR